MKKGTAKKCCTLIMYKPGELIQFFQQLFKE
jgi:hypothetical protein